MDLIYRPIRTKPCGWLHRENRLHSGVEMFLAQGFAQWETDGQQRRVPHEKCRAASAETKKTHAGDPSSWM
jgi:shikimate 5-dehydrogenase